MPTGGELSAEQRARISHSFRAAKTLLARKKPKLESGTVSDCVLSNLNTCRSSDEMETKCPVRVDGIKRLPLSEVCGVKTLKSENLLTKSMPEDYSKYIQSLNDKQQEAACSDISVPLVIVAGPGSGKTSTMVGRILMLLYEGISPSNILAMTFTSAAAAEMRERIGTVAGKAAAKELTISTFHSFSLELYRTHAEKKEE